MPDQRDDPWSAGLTADGADDPWPPGADGGDPDDTSRLRTGRWMSPSLGAYDPEVDHSALGGEPGVEDEYFEKFGYGDSFGDGRLGADYRDSPPLAPVPASPPPAGSDPRAWPAPAMEVDGQEVDGSGFDGPGLDGSSAADGSQLPGWDTGSTGPTGRERHGMAPSPFERDDRGASGNGWSDQPDPGARWTDQVADGEWPNPSQAGPSGELGHPTGAADPGGREFGAGGGVRSGVADRAIGDEDDGDGVLGLGSRDDARRNLVEWGVVLVGAVLLALVLRALVLQAFWIPSPSMETTLLVRDRVLVNKVSYRLHDVNRGDVVVFRRTDAEISQNPDLPHDVIKRVIALGGETIEIRDNQVFIDDQLLQEPYLEAGVTTSDFGPEQVPDGHVFVMGDNRELSLDSRFETGPVAEDRVVGRAFFLFWPINRMGAL